MRGNNTPKFMRLAAAVGRSYRQPEKHEAALDKLRCYMREGHGPGEWRDWATQTMISDQFCGASGQGGFWAVASVKVNEIALELLAEHRAQWRARHGDALFVIED